MHFDRISCHKHGIYRAAAFSIHPDGVCIAWWTTPVSTIIDPPQVSTSTTQKVRHPILLATHFRSFFFYILLFSWNVITWYYLGQLTTYHDDMLLSRHTNTKLIIGSDMKKARQETTTTTRSNSWSIYQLMASCCEFINFNVQSYFRWSLSLSSGFFGMSWFLKNYLSIL